MMKLYFIIVAWMILVKIVNWLEDWYDTKVKKTIQKNSSKTDS